MKAVKRPYDQLSPEALHVVEEFVTRDGNNYGGTEISLETKLAQVPVQYIVKNSFLNIPSISFDLVISDMTIPKTDS